MIKATIVERTSRRPPANSVIVVMTKAHDYNDIYNRLIGIPERAKALADKFVEPGTRVFIYYKSVGISKIVRAASYPYINNDVVPEWRDGLPETYPVRIDTLFVHKSNRIVEYGRLRQLGVRREDTRAPLVPYHLMNNLIPIGNEDGDKVEEELP